jgi:hypothetical protein
MIRSTALLMILALATTDASALPLPTRSERHGTKPPVGYDPGPDFEAHAPGYRAKRRRYREELDRLRDEMAAQQGRGRKVPCTRQVLLEANWLVGYMADFKRIERKLADLQARLAAPADPHKGGQVESDGSFACCTEEWFLRLDETVEHLIAGGFWLSEPKYPVRLLERVNSPEKLRAYLDSILVSDIRRTGVDTRFELNMGTSALVRLILWQGTLKELPTKVTLHSGLRETILDYMDRKWQDPESGYWGTWYRAAGGEIVRTADLSQTFHLASFRGGRIEHWPAILRTTLAFKDREYPYGWLEDGAMSNHHNYDVVLLFHLGWSHADAGEREQIRAEIARMLRFCREQTLQADGSFRMRGDEATLSSNFYFGVAFLNEIGYFATERFWSDEKFPEAAEVRDRIESRIVKLGLDDPEAKFALMLLRLNRSRR